MKPPAKIIPTSDKNAILPRDRWGLSAFTAIMIKSEPPVDELRI